MPDAAPARRVVAAERLFDGTGAPPTEGLAVLVEGRHVVAVDRVGTFAAAGLPVAVAPGTTLLPGLIDSHVHSEMASGTDHVETLSAWHEDRDGGRLGLRALANARAALAAGVTTLRDCGASLGIVAVREALRASGLGPRLLVTGPPITTPRGHCHWFGGETEGHAALRARVAEHVEAGVDAIKVVATGGVMTEGSDPGRAQYSERALRVVVSEAHRWGRPVVAHANATVGIGRAFAVGADTIDHLGWLDRQGRIARDAALMTRLGAARQLCGVTMGGIHRRELDAGEERRAALRARFADKAALLAAGARLHVQSDAGVRLTPFDRPDLSLRMAIEAVGLPGAAALAAMTGVAAEAVGLGGEVGVLRSGATADLLVVEGDPTVEWAALGRVREVWFGGRRVVAADGSERHLVTTERRDG